MEKEFFLIRHGQTAPNIEGGALGLSDPDLTEAGSQEIESLIDHLGAGGVSPQRIYTSLLKRTMLTAEKLQAGLGGEVVESDLLGEVDYGEYEGCSRGVLREIEYGYHAEKMRSAGAEAIEDVERRINDFLAMIAAEDEDSILIVTHAFFASVFTQMMMGVPRKFSTIQPLKTGDYHYFKITERSKDGSLVVLNIQTNCFKEPLNI
jgi:broad specificity phosphatase PhoE